MIAIPANADNRALAAVVNGRIRAEGMMLAARAALWRFAGIGIMLMLAGIGLSAACYGYAYVEDSRTSFDKMASAFAAALDHANLGRVRLEVPDELIKLDPNATVHLDPAATVHLAPQSGPANSDPDRPRPDEHQLNGNATTSPNTRVVTNYTIFKTVPFGGGFVQTGWNFASSDQDKPTWQFCNYHRNSEGGGGEQLSILIAADGQVIQNTLAKRYNLNARTVAANCKWFDGTPTTE
jgi:hypothetical protein